MVTRRVNDPNERRPRRPPATTPEARENQLISMAFDTAEQQFREGSASAQVITHFLKLGSSREKLDQERLRNENELLEIKTETMRSAKRVEELYGAALDAMRAYSGNSVAPDVDHDTHRAFDDDR